MAALVLERNPQADAAAVREALTRSARDLSARTGRDPLFGVNGLAAPDAAASRLAAPALTRRAPRGAAPCGADDRVRRIFVFPR